MNAQHKNVKYTPSRVWRVRSHRASQATWAVTARGNGGDATEYGGLREHYELRSYYRCVDSTLYRGGRAPSEVSCVPLRSVVTDGGLNSKVVLEKQVV